MINTPVVKLGVVGVSRDCFPIELSRTRLAKVVEECKRLKVEVNPCGTIIESEKDAMRAASEMRAAGVDALAIYLGNFGPEGPTTIFAREMGLPFMLVGAAEESKDTLVGGRGDAFCGMLNASLNCGLRGLRPYIPERPVGLPGEVAALIKQFAALAKVLVGLRRLKVFSFGPRPQDFYACNAPLKPLYDLGIEVMENSELDMYELFRAASGRTADIDRVAGEMAAELGAGNNHPEKLRSLAQFELALTGFIEENLGSRMFGVLANKCWPSFEKSFGFVPCYVNSRLAARGIPVACEVDMYGAVSEYMVQLASGMPATLLDVNNTVPPDMDLPDLGGASREDLWMGFHCGNTASSLLCDGFAMKYQLIMHRLMEAGREPDITAGTLEGRLKPGGTTVFRLQARADNHLQSYVAEGEIVDADPRSFGAIGIFAIPGFGRFYRHVLLEKQYPHHAAIGFARCGRTLYDAVRMLGVEDVAAPLPAGTLYRTENPFG